MTIQNNSPLSQSEFYYLNSEDFESELFFTDSDSTKYVLICTYDYDAGLYKVVYNGILQGYSNNTNYDYRLNVDKFIKVEQPREIDNLAKFGDIYEDILFQDFPKLTCKMGIILNDADILTTLFDDFDIRPNGEVYLYGDPTSFTECDVLMYQFLDKENDNLTPEPNTSYIKTDTWVAINCWFDSGTDIVYFILYDKDGNEIGGHSVWGDYNYQLKTFLFYIHKDVAYATFTTLNNPDYVKTYKVTDTCLSTPYFYFGLNGFETIYLEGNEKESETTTKEYINGYNNKYLKSINTIKSIKRNTGYFVPEKQIYEIVKTPYVFNSQYGSLDMDGRNLVNSSLTYLFYHNGTGLGEPTLMEDEYEHYYRMTPDIYNTISINDGGFNYDTSSEYINSLWVRHNCNTAKSYVIYNQSYISVSFKVINIQPNIWTRVYTQNYNVNDVHSYIIIEMYSSTNDDKGKYLDVKKYQIEKGTKLHDWNLSLEEQNRIKPEFKRYLIENSTFDSYTDVELSDRNIELILTDEKTYKRKTNTKLNFYD